MAGLDLERWSRLWNRLGYTPSSQGSRGAAGGDSGDGDGLQAAFIDLRDRHGEPQRAYHTGEHVAAVLAALDGARDSAEDADCCELALWFHDVIYDVKAKGGANEAASADHCLAVIEQLTGSVTPQAERAARHIRATAHTAGDAPPGDPDTRLVLDCDLSILGAAPDAFDRYDQQIRVEYGCSTSSTNRPSS
ncbi:MAG: HD domain-containing protein [Planctomycetota bacterium]|jgi:predicted metal-dependent HD superfamily phosphohydrolase